MAKYSARPSCWKKGLCTQLCLLSIITKLNFSFNWAVALMCRDTEVLWLRKCSAKRKGVLTEMLSGVNFLYTTYTCNNIGFLVFSVHCRTKLSIWAGAALCSSKLRLH